MRNANLLKRDPASLNHARFQNLVYSRVNGQTRIHTAQSVLIFAQYEKHASPSMVHLVIPETFERLNVTGDGSASGIALLGHAFEHALQS